MFPLVFIKEDCPYKITLACDQRWIIISTGALRGLDFILSQYSLAGNEGYVTRDNSGSHLPLKQNLLPDLKHKLVSFSFTYFMYT